MKAFPYSNDEDKQYHWINHGMDLRDYFAAGIMVHFGWAKTLAGDKQYDKVNAKRCYEIADAMMKAREQK
jgi:hypothetical protein